MKCYALHIEAVLRRPVESGHGSSKYCDGSASVLAKHPPK